MSDTIGCCWLPFPGISAQRTKHGEFSWLLDAHPNPLAAQLSSYCFGRQRDCSHTPLLKLHSEHFAVYSLLNVRLWRTADSVWQLHALRRLQKSFYCNWHMLQLQCFCFKVSKTYLIVSVADDSPILNSEVLRKTVSSLLKMDFL